VRAIVIAGLDVVDAQGDRLAQHSERRVERSFGGPSSPKAG